MPLLQYRTPVQTLKPEPMSDPMKNPDPNDMQRRDLGEEDERDGLDIAERLYGGLPTDSDKIDQDDGAQ